MIRLRPMTLGDGAAVQELNRRNGRGEMDVAQWRARWETYPFAGEFGDIPIGWVLDSGEGSVAGAFANVHMLYELDGRRLRGCLGCDWVVDPASRGLSLQLLNAFLKQEGADLCIIGSASPVTSEILTRLKVARIPAPDYDMPHMWALRARPFAGAALRKKGIKGAGVLAWPAGAGLYLADLFGNRGRGRLSSTLDRLPRFDERFDEFWERLRKGPRRLRAVRNRVVLEWRRQGETTILASTNGRELSGYAVLYRRPALEFGMSICDVVDLNALAGPVRSPVTDCLSDRSLTAAAPLLSRDRQGADESSRLRDLLLGAIRCAREDGADALKFATGDAAKHAAAASLRAHRYRVPLWTMFFKAGNPDLAAQLSSPHLWDFSLFDYR